MGVLGKARLALALSGAALEAAEYLAGGGLTLPSLSRLVEAVLHASLPGLEPPSLGALALMFYALAGLLSLASPAGLLGAAAFTAAAVLAGHNSPGSIVGSALTGALALALARDAAAVISGAPQRPQGPRLTLHGAGAPGSASPEAPRPYSYFPIGPLRIPRILRGFRVVEYLGRGGQMAVYKVVKDDRYYVMKIPLDKEKAARAFREFELLKKLAEVDVDESMVASALKDCGVELDGDELAAVVEELRARRANFLSVVDYNKEAWDRVFAEGVFDASDPPFMVVEYADLGDALRLTGHGGAVAKVLLETSGALALFHLTTGMVHRDVKPENILLSSLDGGFRPILADFGSVSPTGAQEGWSPGTPLYMPPEALFYKDTPVTPAYDVYSLGVLAYRLLTGEYPIRQYYFIAVSRHPRISEALRQEALRIARTFEFTNTGTSGAILKKIRDIVYPPHSKAGDSWKLKALEELDRFLEENPSGALITSHERETLRTSLVKAGLPDGVLDVVLKALKASPRRRQPSPLCFWVELRRALAS